MPNMPEGTEAARPEMTPEQIEYRRAFNDGLEKAAQIAEDELDGNDDGNTRARQIADLIRSYIASEPEGGQK